MSRSRSKPVTPANEYLTLPCKTATSNADRAVLPTRFCQSHDFLLEWKEILKTCNLQPNRVVNEVVPILKC